MAGPSRYDGLDIATAVVPDGAGGTQEVRYLRRRFPPPPSGSAPLALHRVRRDDRLDLISARYLGDPTGFWRICDANAALDPDALVDAQAEDSTLVVPVPEV